MKTNRIIPALLLIPLLLSCLAATTQPDDRAAFSNWTADLPAFINTHPQHRWIVGTCREPGLSAAEAQADAEHDAAEQLASLSSPNLPPAEAAQLTAAFDTALHHDTDWLADRHVTAVQRPYGTIWNAQILVMADPSQLNGVLHHVRQVRAGQRIVTFAAVATAAIWLAVVGIGYLLLNLLTRGYFRLRLTAMAAVLVLLGFAGIAFVAGSI